MRISLLLRREPFGEILCATLERFLPQLTGRAHQVRWYPGNARRAAFGGEQSNGRAGHEQSWLCNFYLNAIFTDEAHGETLEPVVREFRRSTIWWRRPAQKAYVDLAARRPTAAWLAQARVGITPAILDDGNLLFVGGNHKLRLLDRANGRAYGIHKEGFGTEFLERELHARRLAEELALPVPKLEAVAPDGTWFSENYISGTPLNRLDDLATAQRVLAEMKSALGRLSRHTMQETSVGAYVGELAASIRRHLDGNKLLDAVARDVWKARLQKLLRQLEFAGERSLLTSLAHGDFQPANILHHDDSSSSWLIDWELSARRQAGYDALVYAMRSRSSVNLAARLRDFREGVKAESSWLLEDWPGAEWESGEARKLSATLLLVEDLAMQLEENANARFVCLGEGLTLLGAEIDQWNAEAEG